MLFNYIINKTLKVNKVIYFYTFNLKKTTKICLRIYLGFNYFLVNNIFFYTYFKNITLSLQSNFLKNPDYKILLDTYNFYFSIYGGGLYSQYYTTVRVLARTFIFLNNSLKNDLRDRNLITIDTRHVEQKKYGLHKARKAVQYSKR